MAISRALRFQILRRDNHTCQTCGRSAPEVKLQVDHVVPEALGGRTVPENLRALCAECNGGKAATPPDAAAVAQVAADAERWAAAQQIAAERLLSNRDARNEVHRQFVERWTDWEQRIGEDCPFEQGWQRSLDTFIAQGVPVEVLMECVDKAMRSKKPSPDDRFKYLCGIAWSLVRELRDATASIAAGGSVAATPDVPHDAVAAARKDGQYELAVELLNNFDEADVEGLTERALRYEDEPLDGPSQVVATARHTMTELVNDNFSLDVAIWQLIRMLPADITSRAIDNARALIAEYVGEDVTKTEDSVQILQQLGVEFAKVYLATLDPLERAEWIASGIEYFGTNADPDTVTIYAVEYAQATKKGGGARHHMCANSGDHGAMCPRRAEYEIWIDNCGACAERGIADCQGHVGLCARHLEDAVEGHARSRRTGEVYRLTNFAEVKPNADPWAVA